ncbi:hypothetical protein RFI_31513 [Reticulomyxa filosa]|uniref:Uncharacterized protein n=1 Tax=Reticulomyxa filosa TaxID=46433 RepID=X6LXN2_RETFI|nr:hypothetical protein RFI_31513 [Reticulomyxa filosa]|eukprot:ETO05882.1 hypothetical protein RFI_31513 [Reticulomyxa filosa]
MCAVLSPRDRVKDCLLQLLSRQTNNHSIEGGATDEFKHCRIDGGAKNEPISAEDCVRVDLVENKKMIFLDALTECWGLLSAEQVVRDIILLAKLKLLTVFVTLRHPTKLLLEKFQKCLFLRKGHCLYFGRVRNSVDFFTRLRYPISKETSIYDHTLGLTIPDAALNNNNNKNENTRRNY